MSDGTPGTQPRVRRAATDEEQDVVDSPLVDAWHAARAEERRSLQIPGHKNRYAADTTDSSVFAADLLGPLIRDDLALQGGVDDNALSHRFVEQAEALWAAAVGADYARFLVGGSSQGNISALSTVAEPGRPVAVDRTSHRSTQAALVISGARPVWVYPTIHPEFHLPVGLPADSVAEVPTDATALFVTSPSYVGTITDVTAVAARAHARGLVLVVDQAWGAHLDFLPGRGALACGADLAVTSVHKALLGYTQTAVVAMRDERVARAHLDRCVDLTATTSPSVTLLASIDATRAALVEDEGVALARTAELVDGVRRRLARVRGLVVLDEATAGCPMDPFKVTLVLPGTGVSGLDLAAALWEDGHGVETADRDTLVLTMTLADDADTAEHVSETIAAMVEARRTEPRPPTPGAVWRVEPEVVVTPREAFFARRRRLPLREAIGEVSAEQFCPYPPGVPLLAPGERVTVEAVDAIEAAGRVGRVAYSSDPTLATIEVVDAI